MVNQVVTVHADTIDGHCQRVFLRIRRNPNFHFSGFSGNVRMRQRHIFQLVAGVAGIRNQFAQKNLLFRIQRIDHNIEHFADIGLKIQLVAHLFLLPKNISSDLS